MTNHGWPRRRVLGLAAAAGGALVAPLATTPTGSPALADPAATGTTATGPAPTGPAAGGTPNAAITWDRNAQTAIWDIAGQQPNEQVRSFAMVSGAVYDAANAAAGEPYQSYLVAPQVPGRVSTRAAVATAAYQVLADMFPAQQERLAAQYHEYLAGVPNGGPKAAGIEVGGQAAAAMIEARRDDGAFGNQTWTEGVQPGQWRPTPPGFVSVGAWTAYLKAFLIRDPARYRAPGPPALTSHRYARDVEEVAAVGSATSTVRTADQTEAAIWWHDRRSVGWAIKRQLAATQRLGVLQTARLFALVDMSVADSGTVCFQEKERWSFWRPVTAIQEAGADGNPRTRPDPTWTPLLVTPPFPEYPSGHASGTAARMAAYRAFFGRDRVAFSAYSVDADATRHFSRFSQALAELIEARIWGGIHYRAADLDGAVLGQAVADYAVRHYFRRR